MRTAKTEVEALTNRGGDLVWRLLPIFLCIAFIVFVLATWQQLPERIPTHFNAAGEADAWSTRGTALTLPLIAFSLFVLMQALEFFPND